MSQPDFNPDERYVLARYKSDIGSFDWGTGFIHLAMVGLFSYGLYRGDQSILFSAFGVVIGWRVYEQTYRGRFIRATQSVFAKYEAKVAELSDRPRNEG